MNSIRQMLAVLFVSLLMMVSPLMAAAEGNKDAVKVTVHISVTIFDEANSPNRIRDCGLAVSSQQNIPCEDRFHLAQVDLTNSSRQIRLVPI